MDIKTEPKRKDRQSGTGIFGSPKKGGGGGKGTWGIGGLDDLKAVSIAGPGDPNYDSEDEADEEVVILRTEIASPVEVLVREFLQSGDIDDTKKGLQEASLQHLHEQFVKKLIIFSMEKQGHERESVSKLLSSISGVAMTPEKIAEGFQAALNSLEDVVLDTPHAVDILSKFLARAIIDEVLPPAFLKHAAIENPLAEQCLTVANNLSNQPFRSERLAEVWGVGDISSVKSFKEEITLLFEEYLTNADYNDAEQSVRELNSSHFHPQLVKQALRLALGKDEADRKKILSLLAFFCKSDLISQDHVEKGFGYCCETLDDLKLDVVNAPTLLVEFIRTAKAEGWLNQNFQEP